MIIIRPIKQQDIGLFEESSSDSLLGITNLTRDKKNLLKKIIHSEKCLGEDIQKAGDEEYYFVLEDLATGRLGGICGIMANSALSRNFFYKFQVVSSPSKHPSSPKEIQLLRIISNRPKASEVCSLYLLRSFRHSGLGRLLSLSRFLFIASHRVRFRNKIVADLRGFIDETHVSPFWENVGRHFCNLSFVELMTQLDNNRSFIGDILPKYPLYVALLPSAVQSVIGQTHESSKPALSMLAQEGFTLTNEIDIFDGGPSMRAATAKIRSIKRSARAKITVTNDSLENESDFLLSNEKSTDFRACIGKLKYISRKKVLINQETAEALLLKSGDMIRYITPQNR